MNIRVAAKGLAQNGKLIDHILNQHDEELQQLLHSMGESIVAEAKSNLQQNQSVNTGTLLGSVNILEEQKHKIIVGSRIFYAGIVEFGRGPVFPVKGQALKFMSKDGNQVMVKSVGPAEPKPYLQPAVEKHTRLFQGVYVEKMENEGKKAVSGIGSTEEF